MDPSNILYESTILDGYNADDPPVIDEMERSIPVYARNTSLSVKLTSTYPNPVVLHSMRWEGDYNNRFYKRV